MSPRLYIIAGQSNAVGGALASTISNRDYAASYPDAQIRRLLELDTPGTPAGWDRAFTDVAPRPPINNPESPNTIHGVELTLARGLAEHYGPDVVLLFHAGTSGTNLAADWLPTATTGLRLYSQVKAEALRLVKSTGAEVCGFVWIQGNGDANTSQNATNYAANLRTLIRQVRTDFPGCKFVYDQLTPYETNTYKDVVRAGQATVASEVEFADFVTMLPTEGYTMRDVTTHYDSNAFIQLGRRFARALLTLENEPQPNRTTMPNRHYPSTMRITELRFDASDSVDTDDNSYILSLANLGRETVTSGALSLDILTSDLSVTGTQAFTLADGRFVGQRKIVSCSVAASTPLGTLTINDAFGSESTVHVFTAVGQRLELEWTSTGWKMIAKRRAGTQVAVIGTTVLTGYDMALLYDCQVTGTVSSTTTKSIPDGTVPGETMYTGCSVAASTPIGNINFTGSTLAGAAVTDLQAIGATTDTVTLVWTGAKWLVVANSGITVA